MTSHVFPDSDRQPPFGCQLLVCVAIPPLVAGDLLGPVPLILDVANPAVLLAAVPEAPVDKHGDAGSRKHKISLAAKLRQRTPVDEVPEPYPVKLPT